MYVFRNGVSSSTKEGPVYLCSHYVLLHYSISAWVYPRCQGVQVTMDSAFFVHCTVLSNMYARYTEIFSQCRHTAPHKINTSII
jgi:hypothetical protein